MKAFTDTRKNSLIFLPVFLFFSSVCFAKLNIKQVLETEIDTKNTFECFSPSAVRTWNFVDDRNLIVHIGNKRKSYLLQIFNHCHFLDFNYALKLISKDDDKLICENDYLALANITGDSSCEVKHMLQLDPEKLTKLFKADASQNEQQAKENAPQKNK